MKIDSRKFSNEHMTLTYDPCICTQSETCARELSNVFRNSVIPWVDLEGAPLKDIKKQVKKCPSGALKLKISKTKEVA